MNTLNRFCPKAATVSLRFTTNKHHIGLGGSGISESAQTSDTSDDESAYGDVSGNYYNERPRKPTKHKAVKKAIAEHMSAASNTGDNGGSNCNNNGDLQKHPLNVTRVVKTRKPDSVMGEGLVVSEQIDFPASAESGSDSYCTNGATIRRESPAPAGIESLRKKIHEKSKHVDCLEPQDVLLHEPTISSSTSAVYKPSLMRIDKSFVPPELSAFGLGLVSWEHFAAALNAAIPRGPQEIQNQISRWNRDAFKGLGFAIALSTMDPSPMLLVSALQSQDL
ncbi:hypothetical protein GGI25_002070 [Coemansia spiralis]|uniref:Uncharacterized protein n=2 Tax=Coemansia TaxID=4863 RepID=A0A9W8KZB6_9FUNG|nr:hypothetical protein BX070DRAFT_250052 [Coemansia spiralis]KAJ1988859.1 hypothetical protein EDC05_005019 [Coemansia umbellata]KAJ2619966.1 hypothetical protein GGI26_005419 [Coemansia sp. RSA 1358]KAJ2678686.1 hypothetical protein GGI25_002070 [Coemansia spiralis]